MARRPSVSRHYNDYKKQPSMEGADAPVHSDRRTYNPHEHDVDLARDTFDQNHAAYQKPQDRENQQAPNYDNDVKLTSWLRNGDACTKPGFDHSPPRNKMRR